MPRARGRAAPVLLRPRLQERLDESFGKRLTTVVAGAGYGKTTLLAAWRADVACAWCALSPRDGAVDHLAERIVGALRSLVPAAPLALESAGSAHDAAARETDRAESVAGLLCDRLRDALAHDVVLVLDDVDELPAKSGGAHFVKAICRHAPPLLHVVIASRTQPPFSIQRLRGRGGVLELTSADLAFTRDEVRELADRVLGDRREAAAWRLHADTGGWPAAVVLALEAIRTTPEPEVLLNRLARPNGPLHAYLAEEVFAKERPAVRELLRRACILDRVSAELGEAVGAEGADDALAELVRRGLAAEAGDGWFSVHAVVREFAAGTWPLADEEAADAHAAAAAWFEERGLYDRALDSFAQAGDATAIASLLAERGREILARCGAETVVRYGALASAGGLDEAADLVVGEAYTILGETHAAFEHLLRAARGRRRLPTAVAWRLVAACQLVDDLDAGVAVYRRAHLQDGTSEDAALLLAWTAGIERRRGNHRKARSLAERALRIAERTGDERAVAHAAGGLLVADARDADAERHLRRALEAAERSGDLFQCARVRNHRASQLLEQGLYAQAFEELNETMELAERGGFTSVLALATVNRGLCHWCRGRLDEARAEYEAATALYRHIGSSEAAYALVGLGDVHRERGDVVQARARYEEGLALAERAGDRQALVPALYQLAKVLVDDEPERADEFARRAVAYGWPDLPWALNASGWIALARGEPAHAAQIARRAAAAARERSDTFGLAESLELEAVASHDPAAATRLLGEALRLWRLLDNAVHAAAAELALARLSDSSDAHRIAGRTERRLQDLGVRISPAGPAGLLRFVAERHGVPVALETLGGFRVAREEVPVPAREWRSQKARDLLKILAARRGAPTRRDVLMEALWPEVDAGRAANRLSVALSTVRSVLDPGKRFDSDRYISADGDTVALVLQHVVVDVEEFVAEALEGLELRDAGAAAEASERLEHAVALYRGDFLEEDADEEWAVPLRELARALHAEVAHALAADAAAAGRYDHTVRYCLRILDRDPYDERAHLALVTSLIAGCRHGDARRAYRAYCSRMEEISVEPAPFPVPV
jgi:ATP/maltotriose-dependent transcriptional regulator MalT/DNA-binding SARP family transcriptional activator